MLRTLLICGLIAGAVGGICAFGFGSIVGEPAIDESIAYEEANAPPVPPGEEEEEVVSRGSQKGFGLFTATVVFGLAIGGIFALVFAFVYGRIAPDAGPARTALWLAAAAFVVIYLVPFLKYPPNPPAVGDPATIGERTGLYMLMVWISVFAAVAGLRIRTMLSERMQGSSATLAGGASYLVIVAIAGIALPSLQEVPTDFPATTLWAFRESSVGMHLVLWTGLGLVFAPLAQRVMSGQPIWSRGSARGAEVKAAGD